MNLPRYQQKTPRPAFRKSEAVRDLEVLSNKEAIKLHPGMDPRFIAPRRYTDKTANGLTICILDFLRLQGHQAERINSTGRYVDNTKIVSDVLGFKKRIGSGQWIKGSGQKGTADISSTILGLSVKIEVKMRDRQSPDQIAYQEQVERAGGMYWIVRSFEEFMNKYNELKYQRQ